MAEFWERILDAQILDLDSCVKSFDCFSSTRGPLEKFTSLEVRAKNLMDMRLFLKLRSNCLKALLRGISLSEYPSEGFRVRLSRLSKYVSVAFLVERPTREPQAKQYSDTVLKQNPNIGTVLANSSVHEDRNLLKLRSLDSSCPVFLSDNSIWGQ